MSKTIEQQVELKPCPFCGGEANIDRYGDAGKSTQYSCLDCGATLETNEEFNHGKMWNERPLEKERDRIARKEERERAYKEGVRDMRDFAEITLVKSREKSHKAINDKCAELIEALTTPNDKDV